MYRILVLGGYGNFGARISRVLSKDSGIQLLIAGRNINKARELVEKLDNSHVHEPVNIDQSASNFVHELESLNVDCLIHTSGPYQGQDYSVAKACIQTKTHYIDLADGRAFVDGFSDLNSEAKKVDVLLVTGASTLPGVSSAVVKNFKNEFDSVDSIKICISPGNKAPRGESTISAVLSYCGKPIKCWFNGRWVTKYGWQDLHSYRFPALGKRLLGLCDVPDLSLFPKNYENVKTVLFHAALETKISQLGFWMLAAMTRIKLINYPKKYSTLVYKIGEMTNFMGTSDGGMFVNLKGACKNTAKELTWYLTALNGHGPEIPTIPAIVLARKLANKKMFLTGAMPCFELITLKDFDEAVSNLDISWEAVRH